MGTTPDLLTGIVAIAAHLGLTERQALHQHEKGRLPTFKMGRTVCATRTGLADHFAKLTADAAAGRS